MVWLDEIWGYFLDESDIEEAYIDPYYHELRLSDISEDMLKIPKNFTRGELLREFINNSGDKALKKLSREIGSITDYELLDLYHKCFSPWYDPDNYYSQWVVQGKEKIMDYAERWCEINGIACTRKSRQKFETYSFLTCYSKLRSKWIEP